MRYMDMGYGVAKMHISKGYYVFATVNHQYNVQTTNTT